MILIPGFTGWPDQGVAADVMVHVGSLAAVIVYFWRDVLALAGGALNLCRGRMTDQGRMAIYIVLASIPAVAFGLYLRTSGMSASLRSAEIIAWNAIIFGLLLYASDRLGKRVRTMQHMTLISALIIGVSQAVALIPGTSRSGITITAARFLGFKRIEAIRFSFLLGIPAIAGAGALTVGEFIVSGEGIPADAMLAASFFSALAAIAFLMFVVKHTGFVVFVVYRMVLALVLFALIYEWVPGFSLQGPV